MWQAQVTSMLLLLALCWSPAASRMALETREDYLNHLFLRVKDRPLRNGELNLLPDDSLPGFANTVCCVPEDEEGGTTDTSRKMHFQRVSLNPSEQLISVKLVLRLPAGFSEDGEVTLYKVSDGSEEHKQLDNVAVPSCGSTCWFELNVSTENMLDEMELLLEFTHRNIDFVRGLKPMLVLYTYVAQSMASFVSKRGTMALGEEEHANLPLAELDSRNTACSKHSVELEYSQMKWLGDDITILTPSSNIRFEFCYGNCNSPLALLPHLDPTQDYDYRARILEVMNRVSESQLTPPPCCIPLSYTVINIIYDVGGLTRLTTFPSVEQCGCRA